MVTSGNSSRRGKVSGKSRSATGSSASSSTSQEQGAGAGKTLQRAKSLGRKGEEGPHSAHREFSLVDLMNVLRVIKSDPGIKVKDLASQFSTDYDTMLAVLRQLSMAGVPPYTPSDCLSIEIERVAGGERVASIRHWKQLETGIRLTRDELYALSLAVDGYLATASDDARPGAEALLGKVRRALGVESADDEGGGKDKALLTSTLGHRMRENLAQIQEGLRRAVKLTIEYYSGHTGKLEQRVVWPMLLREGGGHLYLMAFCELRAANRSFRLDRIRSVDVSDERHPDVKPPAASELPEQVPGWDGTLASGQFTVRLEPSVKDEAMEEFLPQGAVARELPDGRVELTLPLYSRPWAIGWVLRHGPHAELLEPKHLRAELVERLRGLAKQFEGVG